MSLNNDHLRGGKIEFPWAVIPAWHIPLWCLKKSLIYTPSIATIQKKKRSNKLFYSCCHSNWFRAPSWINVVTLVIYVSHAAAGASNNTTPTRRNLDKHKYIYFQFESQLFGPRKWNVCRWDWRLVSLEPLVALSANRLRLIQILDVIFCEIWMKIGILLYVVGIFVPRKKIKKRWGIFVSVSKCYESSIHCI